MTEIEAWEFCANEFENARSNGCKCNICIDQVYSLHGHLGLCCCITDLKASKTTKFEMKHAIEQYRTRIQGGSYLWPTNKQGAKLRVKFCREQIRKLKAKGKKKCKKK